jgi:hypothetical protein
MEWIDATRGWLGKTFSFGTEGERTFIWTPENLGLALYEGINYYVNIPEDGVYTIDGEVWAPHADSDSFYVRIYTHEDDGTYKPYSFANGLETAHWRFEFAGISYKKWQVIKVNRVNVYVKPEQRIIPLKYNLKKGEYLIKIMMREDGSRLSKIRFVKE